MQTHTTFVSLPKTFKVSPNRKAINAARRFADGDVFLRGHTAASLKSLHRQSLQVQAARFILEGYDAGALYDVYGPIWCIALGLGSMWTGSTRGRHE